MVTYYFLCPYVPDGDTYSFFWGLIFFSRWLSWTRLHMTPQQHSLKHGPRVAQGKTILWPKNLRESRPIPSHSSCHQSKWITPLSLFRFSRWSQTPLIPCHSATLGAIYYAERQGRDTHTLLPFIRGWSFTMCRSSPQNLLLSLYYVNL